MSQDVTAKGPVLFFTDAGLLIQIPLDKIQLDNGAASTTYPGANDKLKEWLQHLVATGDLQAAESPPPAGALIAKAAVDGIEGNDVQVEIKPKEGAPTKVDVRVVKTTRYTGLTLATLEERLGTAAAPAAANTGLLRVKNNDAGAPAPVDKNPVPVDTAVPGGGGAAVPVVPARWTIAASAAAPIKTVKLEAKREGDGFDQAHFTVAISDATPGGFTLTVTWAPPAVTIEVGDLPAKLNDAFKYLVRFVAPATGFKLPAPVTTTLAGGREKLDALPATATVLAKP